MTSRVLSLEAVLKRERWLVAAGLILVTGLAWLGLLHMAATMDGMPSAGEIGIQPWTAADFALMFWMWAVMMVAMMLPSAAPMILIYTRVHRHNAEKDHALAPTAVFASGYLLVWTVFSLVATLAQWGLDEAALLSERMVAASPLLGGLLLVAAGVYQWTPWKDVCLHHCRSPVQFIATRWRRGALGALRMGVEHGAYCVGCCWALMLLLFFGGVMNFLWIAAIAFFVLLEKLVPFGRQGGRAIGGLLAIIGVAFLLQAI